MSCKCFIWIALAVIAEVPLVVGVFLSLVINYVLTFSKGLPTSQFEWCVRTQTCMNKADDAFSPDSRLE